MAEPPADALWDIEDGFMMVIAGCDTAAGLTRRL